jgi:hypothetical protein
MLIVAATAEDGISSRVLASSITFNGNNLTHINSVKTTTSLYIGVCLWYKMITSGEHGDIIVTWSGKNDETTVYAYTLSNVQDVVESSTTSYNNSGVTTAGITTLTNNTLLVTACANKDGYLMSAVGTNHTVDFTLVSGSHAGAIGHVVVTNAGAVSGIGFTASPVPHGEAFVMAVFRPVTIAAQLKELSNGLIGLASNAPAYRNTSLKPKRYLKSV